jgi:hypothetical protein
MKMYTIMTEVTLQDIVNIYFLNINELRQERKNQLLYNKVLTHFIFSILLHNILTATLQHAAEHKMLTKYSSITKFTGSTFSKVFL